MQRRKENGIMGKKILIIDGNTLYRDTLTRMLKKDYEIIEAVDQKQAEEILFHQKEEITLILLDMLENIEMGFECMDELSKKSFYGKIPVIVVCNPISAQMEEKLLSYGVSECIRQPFNEKLIRLKIGNIIKLYQYQNELEETVKYQTKRLEMQNTILQKEAEFLKKSNGQIVDLLGVMAEYRNQESGEHIQRIKGYTKILAEQIMEECPEYELTQEQIHTIVLASSLHDIGKIAITDMILLKPGKLSEKEFEYMKSHTICGCEILENIKDAWSKEYGRVSMDICRYHHERYDGNGYPDGLKGDEIPISAQIVSLADVYDALVHERVYKAAIPKNQAYEMILNGECGVFSPQMLKCFTDCRGKMEAL